MFGTFKMSFDVDSLKSIRFGDCFGYFSKNNKQFQKTLY